MDNYYKQQFSKLDQRSYARSLLRDHDLEHENAVYFSLPINADATTNRDDESLFNPVDNSRYRSIAGNVQYLSVGTRPDLSSPIPIIARPCLAHTNRHMTYLKIILHFCHMDCQLWTPLSSNLKPPYPELYSSTH